jgi:hypothetical protein
MLLLRVKKFIIQKTKSHLFLREVLKKIYNFLFSLIFFFPCRVLTINSFIPIVEAPRDFDRIIRKGKFAGKKCYYKTALLNTLIKLKPKICLEIGTHLGRTTEIFDYYFKKYQPEGILITVDIRKYVDLKNNRIKQVLVYPHVANIAQYHDVAPNQMLADYKDHFNDSVKANCEILKRELKKIGAKVFDFSFVDGDHQRTSFLRDLEIVKRLSRPPHYALLDDTKDKEHESAFIYQKELIDKFNHYDFEDWPIFIGMSLIWDKNS